MELFEIDDNDYTVKLNRAWLYLIPEFSDILKRDKGSTGDKGGQRKLWARSRFAYIYFLVDFKSPIYAWDPGPKQEEAMRYTGLDKDDVKQPYMVAALALYKKLQWEAARSLRTLESVYVGLAELNSYFEDIDFKAVDKQGKLLHSAKDYGNNVVMLNKMYDNINAFEKRVMAELTKSGGIRGTATKGDGELEDTSNTGGTEAAFVEGGAPEGSGVNWMNLDTGAEVTEEL